MRVWVLLLIGIAGCGRTVPSNSDRVAADRWVRDSLGRTVLAPESAKRIVSLAASNTEILYSLGLGYSIVGVTEFCDFPEEAKAKPKVGGFAPQTFNIELIAALKPDLVLAAGEFHRPTIEALEKVGITVAGFQGESVEEISKNIELIGALTGHPDRALSVVQEMKSVIAAVTKRVERKPRPKVFYLVSDDPLMTAAGKSMISEAITLAGGENIFGDLEGDYVRISDETVLRRNPWIVFVPRYGHSGKATAPKLLETLDAVKQNRVYAIDANPISRPSPRIAKAIADMAQILHPKE